MKNRSRIEIIGRILEAINVNGGGRYGCSSLTQIMYKAFLGFAQTKEYVTDLIDSDLLLYDLTSQTYRVTEKGMRFLQYYNQVDEMIGLSQQQPEQWQQQQQAWIEVKEAEEKIV